MSIDRSENDLLGILTELRKLPRETEWAEFKHNNADPDEIIAAVRRGHQVLDSIH